MVGTDLLELHAGRVTATDLATLTVHWRADVPPDISSFDQCGVSVCFFADNGTTLVDPATGAVRAVRPWSFPVTLPDGRMLISTIGSGILVVDRMLREVGRCPAGPWPAGAATSC